MTRKDYRLIADALNRAYTEPKGYQYSNIVRELSKALKRDNPRFDESRFEAACGL